MAVSETLDNAKNWLLGIRNVEEAEQGIRRDQLWQHVLKTWSRRLGKTAAALAVATVFIRAGFMIAPLGIALGLYGVVKLGSYLLDRDIEKKRQAEEELRAKEAAQKPPSPSRQPGPKLAAKAAGAFNAKTLPANDAAPQPQGRVSSFLSRLGIGGS